MTENKTPEIKGKSKDIYALPNGNVLMVFKDSFTGTNGVEDPGGNTNIGTKQGLGRKNLEVSTLLFHLINKELGIPTHLVSVDLQNNALEAKRVTILGKGLEFVSRNSAWGSFLRRNPKAIQGESMLDEHGFPFVEVSIKDDAAGDPFFTREQFINRGTISAEDYDTAVEYTKRITKFLTEVLHTVGLQLIDMKIEFGKTNNGEIILSDEISPGSLRALVDGKPASKDEIHACIMHYKPTEKRKPQVSVVMGSDSDLGVMSAAVEMLDRFGIVYEIDFVSAHRTPEKVSKLGKRAADSGLLVIIAGAGGAAHLPGMLAGETTVPVIGVPIISATIGGDGLDALLSIVQMPPGIPVATVGKNRAENAGILAAQIVATSDPQVRAKLKAYKKEMSTMVHEKSNVLQKIGHQEYLNQKERK